MEGHPPWLARAFSSSSTTTTSTSTSTSKPASRPAYGTPLTGSTAPPPPPPGRPHGEQGHATLHGRARTEGKTEFERLQERLQADMGKLQASQEAKTYEERRRADRAAREREAAASRREADVERKRREEEEEERLFAAALRAAEKLRMDLEAGRQAREQHRYTAASTSTSTSQRASAGAGARPQPPPPRAPPPSDTPFRRERTTAQARTPVDAFDDVRVRQLWDQHEAAWERLESSQRSGAAPTPPPPIPWPPHDDGVLASLLRRHRSLNLKAAFRKASLRWHPDKIKVRFGEASSVRAQAVFQAVLASYQQQASAS